MFNTTVRLGILGSRELVLDAKNLREAFNNLVGKVGSVVGVNGLGKTETADDVVVDEV
jgi:hypothetical protein